jgi:hypothetical protein
MVGSNCYALSLLLLFSTHACLWLPPPDCLPRTIYLAYAKGFSSSQEVSMAKALGPWS